MALIAALILSLPERADLLSGCLKTVHAQTRQPDDIVVGIDPRRYGEVGNGNRLLAATDCEWIAWLHSDDYWSIDHLQIAEQYFDSADVVVSRFNLVGRPEASMEQWHDNFEDLRFTNWISSPSCIVVRRSVFGEWVGTYDQFRWNDWAQYNHLLEKGARFVDTQQKTVTCQFGDWGNGSWTAP